MSKYFTQTITAGEDLSGAQSQYCAVALDDGKVAANGKEAGGTLQSRPASGDFATLGIMGGEVPFRAGAAITAGAQLTVTTSGFITTAASGDWKVGQNGDKSVTSGSVGKGNLNFATPVYLTTSFE